MSYVDSCMGSCDVRIIVNEVGPEMIWLFGIGSYLNHNWCWSQCLIYEILLASWQSKQAKPASASRYLLFEGCSGSIGVGLFSIWGWLAEFGHLDFIICKSLAGTPLNLSLMLLYLVACQWEINETGSGRPGTVSTFHLFGLFWHKSSSH